MPSFEILNVIYVSLVRKVEYYTIDDFRWGEYKDWSTHGTWYSPRLHRNWKSL